MSDLDFEELDKAVNSLVGGTPKDEKKEESTETPKPVESTPKPDATPASSNLPSRRAGRFMDMKHDSSDMTKDSSPSLMTSSKTTIAPISKDVKPEPKSDESSNDNEESKNDWSEPVKNETKDEKSDDESSSPSTDMPDPIDHFENQQKENDDKSNETQKPDETSSDKSDEPEIKFEETDNKRDEHEKDDKKPSPFIDDAKVEKRPLGGFTSESTIDNEKKDDKDKEGKEGEEKPAEAPPTPIELPPELDKNLVAIEAGEAPEAAKPEVADIPPPQQDDKDKKDEKEESSKKDDDKDNKKDEPVKDTKHEVSQLLASASSGSIPDQYKRENRSHELHTDHPLFDSEHLKAIPTSAPKKPKSTAAKIFQWIFIALGLLLLGGSLGAAIFVFVSKS